MEKETCNEIQKFAIRLEARVLTLKVAQTALAEIREMCEDADLTAGVFEELEPCKAQLSEIIGALEATIENIKEFE